jgi:TetR/AcrR family transcriptional regulator, transcriptional repressor for nem operon
MGKAEETRNSIIEKSAVVFNKNGFRRASMSTLTHALGLTKGAIYGHFTDKDDLAVEAFRSCLERVRRRIGDRVGGHDGALQKLRAYAESFVVFFEQTRNEGGCPILNTAVDSDDTHPLLLDEARRALIEWEERIVGLVDLGKKTGEFRPGADACAFAANFIALIEGGTLLAKTLDDRKYLERSVGAIDLLIDALLVAIP